MIIHLPTGKKFHNRKEAKIYFDTAYYYKMAQRRESLNMGEFADNPSKDLHLLRTLGQMSISTSEDSTPLRVCRNQRILIHKTFEGLAERGKCSMGWSFGFKLHLIINDKGEILNFMFTPGNVDDREPLKQGKFLENIKGKLFAQKKSLDRNGQ